MSDYDSTMNIAHLEPYAASARRRVAIVTECPHGLFLPHRRWFSWCFPLMWVDNEDDTSVPLYEVTSQFTRQDLIDRFKHVGAHD